MIEAFSIATSHLFQDALAGQSRLRHEVFVRQRKLLHNTFDGLEFDEFDTPAAVYLVRRDEELAVRGVARLLRTTLPYMLKSYWPDMVDRGQLPSGEDVWEVTRVCVDKAVASATRRTIFPELLCGIAEFFEANRIAGMIGVTSEALLSHFLKQGIEWLGPTQVVEGRPERAFYVPTDFIRPGHHCRKYGIAGRVLAASPCVSQDRRAA